MKTVAIVGSHPGTCGEAPWKNLSVPIWVMNEAASIGWPERVDAVFQMHKRAVWMNPNNRNNGKFPEWMRHEHAFPIYMLEREEGVPSSTRYPLEEICKALLRKVRKGEERVRYFTSTAAYMLALAIYQGYERIELYGVEMASDTEYIYQRAGVFFWLGVATGRGIQVKVHPKSGFFTEPMYGYEGDVTISLKHIEKRIVTLEPLAEKMKARLAAAIEEQQRVMNEALEQSGGEPGLADVAMTRKYFATLKEQTEAMLNLGMLEGMLAEDRKYQAKIEDMRKETGSHFLARQEFEILLVHHKGMHEKKKAHMNQVGGHASAAWKMMSKAVSAFAPQEELKELGEAYLNEHKRYLEASYECGFEAGVVNENSTLIEMTDELIKAAGGAKAEEAMVNAMGVPA